MDMDKRTVIGIVLIIAITLLMPVYQKWITGDQPLPPAQTDTVAVKQPAKAETTATPATKITAEKPKPTAKEPEVVQSSILRDSLIIEQGTLREITIASKLYRTHWSTEKGGNPQSWYLNNYEYYKGGVVNLINDNYLDLEFLNRDGKKIALSEFTMFCEQELPDSIYLDENSPEFELKYFLPIGNGKIEKTVKFFADKYSFIVSFNFVNLDDYIINGNYNVFWKNGLPFTEENLDDDASYSRSYAYYGDELESFDASDEEFKTQRLAGTTHWTAIRTKYFLNAIVPFQAEKTQAFELSGLKVKTGEKDYRKINHTSISMKFLPRPSQVDSFLVYLGPLDYYIVKDYNKDLEKLVMNKDWYERLFRPISLMIIPAFKFLYRFIPNYGFVIILFSILIKLILHPLTKKSYQSMSEMQYLQPKMTELREKYKNDPQRLNKEMMKLYKEHGVNPLGGCLPMFLQMPVLFSLFIVFRSTIQLRGEPFILWITDLSRPDMLPLGFSLPLIGDNIHVLPIVMAITMIWQSKMTMTDPKQKSMVYFMPVFMMFIFYSLPSGLNLYYTLFNLLSMWQTAQIKKKMHPKEAAVSATASKDAKPAKTQNGRKRK
ncbi:MAG: membrane protein insertase YidC [Calditrichia bacterium]